MPSGSWNLPKVDSWRAESHESLLVVTILTLSEFQKFYFPNDRLRTHPTDEFYR
jgi:hypothetical protein